MPATRITLALNSKQSQKAPLLVPAAASLDPAATNSIHALVCKTAQSKLRLKKPSRIFVAGTGEELRTEEDWKRCIRNDVTLLVSAGEEYVGVKKEARTHSEANPDCLVHVLATRSYVDQLSVTQLETTAHTLPGIIHAVGQPDLHPGTKFPIGAVFVSRGWIHPPLIGGDIGCGMAWYKTRLSRNQVDGDKGRKVAEKLRGLERAWRTQSDREIWLEGRGEEGNCSAGAEWDQALGTIGAGNHFAEIQIVEEVDDEKGLGRDEVVLLVHSGSRGYGGSILKKYTPDGQVSFRDDSPQAKEYLQDHDRACQWAKANRDLIALRFLSCLEPGHPSWSLGNNAPTTEDIRTAISHTKAELDQRIVVDIWHNNVERVVWPPHPPGSDPPSVVDPSQSPVFIHRKGAAPTLHPSTSIPLPVLPLPGSRATPTLILTPLFTPRTTHGLKNALSLAHGAGRSMSRAKALASLGAKYKDRAAELLEPRGGLGTWVVCEERDLVFEEAAEAYKDVEAVGKDLVGEECAARVGWCRAVVSYKVRDEGR